MLLYFVCLLSFIPFGMIEANPRMIEMYGDTDKTGTLHGTDWNACMRDCLQDLFCGLVKKTVSTGICEYFNWNSTVVVSKTPSQHGVIVAWKRDMDQCPVSRNPPLFEEASVTETSRTNTTLMSYTISPVSTENLTSWKFTNPVYTVCPEGTKVVKRGNNNVCLTIIPFGDGKCGTHEEARQLCKNSGVTITAMDSVEEIKFFNELGKKLLLIYKNPVTKLKDIWLDGVGTATKFEYDDTTRSSMFYPWGVGKSRGSAAGKCAYYIIDDDLLSMGAIGCSESYIKPCAKDKCTSRCYFGAACRVAPVSSLTV